MGRSHSEWVSTMSMSRIASGKARECPLGPSSQYPVSYEAVPQRVCRVSPRAQKDLNAAFSQLSLGYMLTGAHAGLAVQGQHETNNDV